MHESLALFTGLIGTALGSLVTHTTEKRKYKAKLAEIDSNNWSKLLYQYHELNQSLREQVKELNERIDVLESNNEMLKHMVQELERENNELKEVMRKYGILQPS